LKNEDRPPYTALAAIYDHVMAHVDYDLWAEYLHRLIQRHAPPDAALIELGCGTGNLTFRLLPRLVGRYVATDASREMLAVAASKARAADGIELEHADFMRLDRTGEFDVALLAYDGINYARNEADLAAMFAGVYKMLRAGGLFLFDQATPANSINNLSYFDDRFEGSAYSYSRTSSYDEKTRIHTTHFTITHGRSTVTETHEQRAFTRMEMHESALDAGFRVLACLEAFDFETANDDTERIQWVLRKTDERSNTVGA
jgi:SAM-dependent methyltransferase